jgi:alginate export protein
VKPDKRMKIVVAAMTLLLVLAWTPAVRAEGEEAAAAPNDSWCRFLEFDPEFVKQVDDFAQKTKNPTEWLTWGADLRLRTVWGTNWTTLRKSTRLHERHFQRYRTRLWTSVTPVKDIHINTRLVWEPRVLQKGPGAAGSRWVWDEVVFDHLNVTIDKFGDIPLKLIVGRQDIIKGNGWLILDGTPLDGSRTIYFNAVRAIYTWDSIATEFDVAYIFNDSDGEMWTSPWNQTGQRVIEQNERGLMFFVTNKSLENTTVEGFYIYKHDTPRVPTGVDSDIHTIGGRVVGQFSDNVQYRAEGAYQWGNQGYQATASHRAFGFNSKVTYLFKDALNNKVSASYEFLSGDDPDSAAIESFDPLWGRWPQWSELYAYTEALERGRPGEMSNLHRLGFGWEFDPCKVLNFHANYHLLFSDENTQQANANFSRSGSFRGQLFEAKLTHKFSKRVAGHLLGELFCPGNFYSGTRQDPAVFLRYELVFTW